MRARQLAALAAMLAVAACGGGGGGATNPAAPAAPTTAPQGLGTIPMTISIPRGTPSSSARSPQFLSPNIAALAVYDGATLIYVANLALDSTPQFTTVYAKSGSTTVAFGSCTFTSSAAICTLTITSTIGAHLFDLIGYPRSQGTQAQTAQRKVSDTGTPPVFAGVISSEGELSANLSPGTNPGQTLTLLGVASKIIFAGSSEAAFNSVTTYGYRLQDSTTSQIVLPGNAYDNGPITITAAPSGIVTIAPNSIATPPSAAGDQNFTVTCINASGGTVTISFNARTSPNATYASGLTYSTSNYSGATIATTPFTCDPNSSTIPITVQGKHS
jgi:hypothetical protein